MKEEIKKSDEVVSDVKVENVPLFDIETYCDIEGIHDADRFVMMKWHSKAGSKSKKDWDKEKERLFQ